MEWWLFVGVTKTMKCHCCSIFSAIVQKVLEAKAEFCHSVTLRSYLIDPDELSQTQLSSLDISQLHKYAMSDVKRVLIEDKPSVRSSDEYGSKILLTKKLCYLKNYTMWSKLLECKYAMQKLMHNYLFIRD